MLEDSRAWEDLVWSTVTLACDSLSSRVLRVISLVGLTISESMLYDVSQLARDGGEEAHAGRLTSQCPCRSRS